MSMANPLFSSVPGSLLTSRSGSLLGSLQRFQSDGKDGADSKEMYDMLRTLTMLSVQEIMESDNEAAADAEEDDAPSSLGTRDRVIGTLSLFDVLLMMDEEAVHQDADLLALLICMSFSAESYANIPEYCRYLVKAEPTEISEKFIEDIPNLLYLVAENISLPRYRADYSQRVQQGWESLAPLLTDITKQWRKSAKELAIINASYTFAAYLGFQATVFPPPKRNGKFSIWVSILDVAADLYPMLYVKEHLPEDLKDKVQFAMKSPKAAAKEWRDVLKEHPEYLDMRLALQESEDHTGVSIAAYGSKLQELYAEQGAEISNHLDTILGQLLGFYTWCYNVKRVTIPEEGTAPADAVSLMQLPQALTDLGYSLNVTQADLEEKLHRTYTGTPSENTALRMDILTGETSCYQLHTEYLEGRTDTADHLALLGVVPAFLAWPKSITSGDEQAFCNRLLSYLEEREDSPAYKVLGTASGSRYFYLDLMVWSLNTFVDDVEAYFAEVPGGDQVLLQCFRAGSRPGPATRERLEAYAETDYEDDYEEEKAAKAKGSGKKHPSSKKKSKNRKKHKK